MAVLALNALVGGFNRSGGIRLSAVPDYIRWPAPELDELGGKEPTGPRPNGAGADGSRPHRLVELINSNTQSPVQALFVLEANPVFTLHGAQTVRDAFDKVPLVVSFSTYMDETAAAADYVLPVHAYLERYQDVLTTAGLKTPLVGLARPVVKPLFDTRHPGDVMIALAKAMGGVMAGAFPWENYEDCLKQTLADNWETMSGRDYLPELVSEALTPAGEMDFTALVGAADKKAQIQGQAESWPLTLIPYDSMRLSGGPVGTPPFVLKTLSDTVLKKSDVFVEVNPATASRHNLSDGRSAILETPAGKAKVRIHVTEGIVPDVIAMPRGLGHTAYDGYLAEKGVNINTLIGPAEDPVSGLDVAWGIKAKLT
jgi:anaerobic selenocysteine-containing dehydrogenase